MNILHNSRLGPYQQLGKLTSHKISSTHVYPPFFFRTVASSSSTIFIGPSIKNPRNQKPNSGLPSNHPNRCRQPSSNLQIIQISSITHLIRHDSSRSYSNPSTAPKLEPPTNQQRSIINQYRDRQRQEYRARNKSLLLYAISIGVVTLGLSYAAVPLYRVFCSVTGYAGTPQTSTKDNSGSGKFSSDRINRPVGDKLITVRFNADKSDTLDWKFWPCQKSVTVKPGETVLAFYKAKNLSDHDVLGVATYNVTPGQVAPYFAKVECFCFDEQRLLAGEEVDLPIFFFIDKDFIEDPLMKDIDDIVLSYTFFKAKRNSFGHLEPDVSIDRSKILSTNDQTKTSHSTNGP